MKVSVKIISVFCAAVLACAMADTAWAEESSVLKDFSKTTTTETFNLSTEGDIVGRTVVSETKVAMKIRTTDVYNVDSNGMEYVSSRKTETYDDLHGSPVKTVIEKSLDVGGGLYVASVTTITKNGSASATTYQELDKKTGELVIKRRVTSGVDEKGRRFVTIEERDAEGQLKVTKTTITSID